MRTRAMAAFPAGLAGLRRRFDAWRRNRQGRSRIPEPLWAAAAKAAARYGVCRTARALGLDYTALKRHVAVGGGTDPHPMADGVCGGVHEPAAIGGATFVELPAIASGSGCECVLEWEEPGGARMRVELKGAQPGHLAALSRGLWSAGS